MELTFDLDAFEERSAVMEFDGGMSRFAAETAAALAQGVHRHEAIRIRDTAQARHSRSARGGNAAHDLPGMQQRSAQENGPVFERDVQTGRCGVGVLALQLGRG